MAAIMTSKLTANITCPRCGERLAVREYEVHEIRRGHAVQLLGGTDWTAICAIREPERVYPFAEND